MTITTGSLQHVVSVQTEVQLCTLRKKIMKLFFHFLQLVKVAQTGNDGVKFCSSHKPPEVAAFNTHTIARA